MSTLRTRTDLTARDIRRLVRHGYKILAIETDRQAERDEHTIVWVRENGLLIPDHELPFWGQPAISREHCRTCTIQAGAYIEFEAVGDGSVRLGIDKRRCTRTLKSDRNSA